VNAFTDFVNPDAFTVSNAPDYIFLCGGRLDDLSRSLRAQFYELKVKSNSPLHDRVLLAESANNWYRSQVEFQDLLELEEHIAGLSGCVLLFVESPGAIAEFGAFSQMKLIQEKLIVVVEDSYYSQQSFIRNGLIERTMRDRPDTLLTYSWLSASNTDGVRTIDTAYVADTLNEVEQSVRLFLEQRPKTVRFSRDDLGHRLLLIADLIKLSVILIQTEIHELMDRLGVTTRPTDLKRYLYLLERLDLVCKKRYGHTDYFVAGSHSNDYIYYAPRTSTDRPRLRLRLREEFPVNGDKKKALDSFERRGGVGA
jgi:hypothetical protein